MDNILKKKEENTGIIEVISIWCLLILFGVLLYPYTPWAGINVSFSSVYVAGIAGILLLFLSLYLISAGRRISTSVLKVITVAWLILLFLSVILFFSLERLKYEMFAGTSFEVGTVISLLIFCFVFIAAVIYAASQKGSQTHIAAVLLFLIITAAAVHVFLGLFSFEAGMFLPDDRLSLYILFGTGSLLALYLGRSVSTGLQYVYLTLGAMLGILTLFSGSPLLITSLGVSVLALSFLFSDGKEESLKTNSMYAGGGLFVLIGIFSISALFPVLAPATFSQEERASLKDTVHVVLRLYDDRPEAMLIGGVRHSFAKEWTAYRPIEINKSDTWNDHTTRTGVSTVSTLLVNYGLPLILVFIVLQVIVLIEIYKYRTTEARKSLIAYGIFFSFLFFWHVVYVPNATVFVSMAVMLGVYAGLRVSERQDKDIVYIGKSVRSFVILLLVVAGIGSITIASVRFLALDAYVEGVRIVQTSPDSLEEADSYFGRSLSYEEISEVARARIDVYTTLIEPLIRDDKLDEARRNRVAELSSNIARYGQVAYGIDPTDFRNNIYFGDALSLSGFLSNDREQFEKALIYYEGARVLAPQHPLPVFLEAKTYFILGHESNALRAASDAVLLKTNHQSALELLKTLNDIGISK